MQFEDGFILDRRRLACIATRRCSNQGMAGETPAVPGCKLHHYRVRR